MKKTVSVLLSLVLVLSCFSFSVTAADVLPESAHNYENDCYQSWNYTFESSAKGLYVTFSEDTYVEPRTGGYIIDIPDDQIVKSVTVGDVLNILPIAFKGDYIAVYDGNGDLFGTYTGDELAGKTLAVPGKSFSIALVTDSSVTYYGFKVTSVTAIPDELFTDVYYHINGTESFDGSYPPGYEYITDYYRGSGNFVGWATQENGKVCYEEDETVTLSGGRLDLYPVTVSLVLDKDEIFYFNNSSYYFEDEEGHDGYYLSDEDARTLQLQIYKNFGLGPVPGPILSIVLATYPDWEWQGSCYGISAVTALNHFGIIDVRPLQDADCLYDMELDDDLLSVINYYQANAATSYLTENKAIVDGSPMYAQQLKGLYSSVAAGNLCIFTFYKDTVFVSTGHTILPCGAYDDADGNHVIIVYDCNRPWNYHGGSYDKIVIDPDYSDATYRGEDFGAFNWTDDFTQFTSFDIGGEGSPLDWYKTLFTHLSNFIKTFFGMFEMLFA